MKKIMIIVLAIFWLCGLAGCSHTNTDADTVDFEGEIYHTDDLSKETIEWLAWHNGLSEEEQAAVDSIPHELTGNEEVKVVEAASGKADTDEGGKAYTGVPVIVINEKSYFADMSSITNELPDGYEYAGELTEAQRKHAHYDGTQYSVDRRRENLYDFYVYQECGTPLEDGTIDNGNRQWAHVQWVSQAITYNGKEYSWSELPQQTLHWLGLSEEQRIASSYMPPEFTGFSPISISRNGEEQVFVLTDEETQSIMNIIMGQDRWVLEGASDCASDCGIIVNENCSYSYHSDCGTINDRAGNRHLSLTDTGKELVNSIMSKYIILGSEQPIKEIAGDDWQAVFSCHNIFQSKG